MSTNDTFSPQQLSELVLDSVNAGVYVTDRERRIVFWNKKAEEVTGWQPKDILGKRCADSVLCHVDKDNRSLCGKEFCPLHRAITTETSNDVSIIVYGLSASGKRIPMRVSVAPLYGRDGEVVGGVETFVEVSSELDDLRRAQRIQGLCISNEAIGDRRINAHIHYAPHDMVGGDFCVVRRLNNGHYAFLLADVMGHGVAAALHTMCLRSLCDEWRSCETPREILARISSQIGGIMTEASAFATALCGTIDLDAHLLHLTSAGGPAPLLVHRDGTCEVIEAAGMPIGIAEIDDLDSVTRPVHPGDHLLVYSDGVTEISNGSGAQLGEEGLISVLRGMSFPMKPLQYSVLEQQLLSWSNGIRFGDDLTIMEIAIT